MIKCLNCNNGIKKEYKFCPSCGTNLKQAKKCPSCSFENEPDANFCHECGTELRTNTETNSIISDKKKDEVVVEVPVPNHGITIEFNHSSSATFEFAVQSAMKFDSFKEIGDGKKAIYRVTVNDDEIEDLDELLENLKGWRNRRVYHNGEKIPWDSVFHHLWCYARRKVSYKPELFCFGYEQDYAFNLWGCMNTSFQFNEHSKLFQCGRWVNSKGDWEFDKTRMKFELEKELYNFRFCPAINFSLVVEVIDVFPNGVNPSKDKNWKFIESYNAIDGLKVITNEYGYKQERYMKGVVPINMKEFVTALGKKMKFKIPEGL